MSEMKENKLTDQCTLDHNDQYYTKASHLAFLYDYFISTLSTIESRQGRIFTLFFSVVIVRQRLFLSLYSIYIAMKNKRDQHRHLLVTKIERTKNDDVFSWLTTNEAVHEKESLE
jgi:hypothetical protein